MASTPARALGSARARPLTPNSAADPDSIHSPSGGLSTDTDPPGSNATKKKLCHEVSMLLTAAA